MQLKEIRILGKPVHLVDMQGAVAWLLGQASAGNKQFVLAMNPEKIMKAREDEELARIIENKATLLIADGVGLVIAARILGLPRVSRVTGVGLFEEMVAAAAREGRSVFLYGAAEPVVTKAAEVLKQRFPSLTIVGIQHGYEPDGQVVADRIKAAGPDFLFTALGSPKQEKWIAGHLDELPIKVVMGVGGSFDVLAGNVKRAPVWMQKAGLEWLHRLLKQPSRAKRMLNLPRFLLLVIASKFGRRV